MMGRPTLGLKVETTLPASWRAANWPLGAASIANGDGACAVDGVMPPSSIELRRAVGVTPIAEAPRRWAVSLLKVAACVREPNCCFAPLPPSTFMRFDACALTRSSSSLSASSVMRFDLLLSVRRSHSKLRSAAERRKSSQMRLHRCSSSGFAFASGSSIEMSLIAMPASDIATMCVCVLRAYLVRGSGKAAKRQERGWLGARSPASAEEIRVLCGNEKELNATHKEDRARSSLSLSLFLGAALYRVCLRRRRSSERTRT